MEAQHASRDREPRLAPTTPIQRARERWLGRSATIMPFWTICPAG